MMETKSLHDIAATGDSKALSAVVGGGVDVKITDNVSL